MASQGAEYTYTKGPGKGRHSDRRFRFETFTERINNINIDIAHELPPKYEDEDAHDPDAIDDENENLKCNFKEALDRWIELDLTRQFRQLAWKLRPISHSLPQILFHKNDIVQYILDTLRGKDLSGSGDNENSALPQEEQPILAWESCFDLLTVLAR